MKEKVHCSLPCIKCGECCRHGGECVFRGWGPVGTPIEFAGACQFLGEDSLCEKLTEAGNNSQFDLARFVPGKCDWPAQFLRHYHPDTYARVFPDEEYGRGPKTYHCCPTHCCQIHGCKYGFKGCPVATGKLEGMTGQCEQCGLEEEEESNGLS